MAETTTAPQNRVDSSTDPNCQLSRDEATGELLTHLKEYAQERPDVAALWCLGIGFVLGWKLKPW